MKIVIVFGSTTGNTESAAGAIAQRLECLGEVSVRNVAGYNLTDLQNYDVIILGTSTWGAGELQADWEGNEDLGGADLSSKKAAVFGTGDQSGFCDTFVDGLAILARALENAGAQLVGKWPVEGYDFSCSAAVSDGFFAGLALDDDNQPELTGARVAQWTGHLVGELA